MDREILRKEIEEQIEGYDSFINKIFPFETLEKVRQVIIHDEERMSLYNRKDVEEILEEYIYITQNIKEKYTSPEYSDKKNILNILEYIRFMSTYENIKEPDTWNTENSFSILSQSAIASVFLGKGVCASQARQMRDILPMDSKVLTVKFCDEEEENLILELHDVVISKVDGEEKYLDPTWYNGTVKSLKGSNGKAKTGNCFYESLESTQEEIEESRQEVALKLIKELGIDEISSKLQLESMDDIKKQCTIFAYIENGIDIKDCELTHLTTRINGKNIEVGKAIELFFINNNIQYSLFPNMPNKSDSLLKVGLNGKQVLLRPRDMYNLTTGRLTQKKLHSKIQNDEIVPVWNGNLDMKEEYRVAIREGREKIRNLSKVDTIDIEQKGLKEIIKDDIKKVQISPKELMDLSNSIEKDMIKNAKVIVK